VDILKEINQKEFDSGIEKAMVNLLYTSNWFRDYHHQIFSPFGIKPQHYNILRILKGKHPQPISPGEIKEVMLDKAPDLTRLLDKLEDLRYVDRHLCPVNRRKMDILITKSGKKILNEINKKNKKAMDSWTGRLSEKEAEKLSELLDKFRG